MESTRHCAWATAREARDQLGVSERTLARWHASGLFQPGQHWRRKFPSPNSRAIPPGAVPGRDERGHSPLSALTGAEPCEHERHKKCTGANRCDEVFAEHQREIARSELLLPEPHALKPGVGLLQASAVIGLQNIGNGDHQIECAAVVAAAAVRAALQGVGELEKLQFSEPVTLLKSRKSVVLLVRQAAGA